MHIVGTDEITVAAGSTAPAGHRHGVDSFGRVLCRSTRARFTWPGLSWSPADASPCPACVQVHRSQQMFTPFPPAPVYDVVPAQPVS